MASSIPGNHHEPWHGGRDFASQDPERQREVVGYYVVRGAIDTRTTQGTRVTTTSVRTEWLRVQPDRESGNFEGSSSRFGG